MGDVKVGESWCGNTRPAALNTPPPRPAPPHGLPGHMLRVMVHLVTCHGDSLLQTAHADTAPCLCVETALGMLVMVMVGMLCCAECL